MEIVFYVYFHVVLRPKANQPYHDVLLRRRQRSSSSSNTVVPKNPYREPYHIHKHLLLRRILYRLLNDTIDDDDDTPSGTTVRYDPIQVQTVMTHFIVHWFHHPPPTTTRESHDSVVSSSCDGSSIHSGSSSSSSSSIHSGSSSSGGMEEDSGSVSSTDEPSPLPPTTTDTASTPPTTTGLWTIPHISKRQMNDCLAWSMFNKHMNQMTELDVLELQKCFEELQNVVQLVFYDDDDAEDEDEPRLPPRPLSLSSLSSWLSSSSSSSSLSSTTPFNTNTNNNSNLSVSRDNNHRKKSSSSSTPKSKPRRLCLEEVNAWHRPLLIYGIVYIIRVVLTRLVLQYGFGFQRIHSQKVPGVTGWYRPADNSTTTNNNRIPMIFFHGIAPAGVFFYLPMLLFGSDIITRDRCCMLIDNFNIACTLMFEAKSEQEMVWGVQDLIDTYLPNPTTTPIAVCGHSFGSCIVSWLFYHGSEQLQKQIQLCVLLDPVTILLSDPNVMNNFLYSHKVLCAIRMFASSELFTEYYLRHHFSWYNSELWLDEILPTLTRRPLSTSSDKGNIRHLIVGLSECDEIVDAPKVKRHIDLFLKKRPIPMCDHQQQRQSLRTIYWKAAGHANCLKSQSKWRDIQRAMLECEIAIAQQGIPK